MSNHQARRLAAIEEQRRQRQVEQAHAGGATARILARLQAMRARMEASGEVIAPVSDAELAQRFGEYKAGLQARLKEQGHA